ncbi:hypothetical protein GCM10022408_21220 [Hymenobacter fastidiosus]|uniref:Uncharacterized protein n=1 Tax=Hymenobacter fastidiosus TaxID=486264 RepID=A0ABP7S9W4_9BACT
MPSPSPFAYYTHAGHRVQVLHQIGRASIARLNGATYVVRFGRSYAEAATPAEAIRYCRQSHTARTTTNGDAQQQIVTWADLVALGIPAEQLAPIYEQNGLDTARPYTYGELRKAIFARRRENCAAFRHWLIMTAKAYDYLQYGTELQINRPL